MKTLRKAYLLVTILVTVLFLLNASFLWFLSTYHLQEIRTSASYQSYTAYRGLLLRPTTLVVLALFMALAYVLRRRKIASHPQTDAEKIAIIALLLSSAYGLVILILFRF